MPVSQKAQDLLKAGKLNYGDPCYEANWNSTIDECKRLNKSDSLASLVFSHYNIAQGAAPSNDWTTCCPLDLINQDPFSCIKMSLEAMLLSGQYWEVYADEFGRAKYIQILNGSQEGGERHTISNIQYCMPTISTQDLADMVIVRGAQPPPFRRCGSDWFTILDNTMNMSTTTIRDLGGVFPTGNPSQGQNPPSSSNNSYGPVSLQGMKVSWGHVNGLSSEGTDSTCDHGVFAQFGIMTYPDFQRKQSYRDEYVDLAEVQSHETILFWLIDVDYGMGQDQLKHYNVSFTKSSEIPVALTFGGGGGGSQYFGPVCDLGQGAGTWPRVTIEIDNGDLESNAEESCTSIESSSKQAKKPKGKVSWDEYSMPAFYGYGGATSRMNFLDVSKWSVGSNMCVEDQFDNMYESTTAVMANGCSLEEFKHAGQTGWGLAMVDIGWQKDRRTFDLPQSSVWVEIPHSALSTNFGTLNMAIRSKAPDAGSMLYLPLSSSAAWVNPYHYLMLKTVGCRYMGTQTTEAGVNFSGVFRNPCGGVGSIGIGIAPNKISFKPPGLLLGLDEGLYTVDEFWAKVSIARPGISVKGLGASADDFLQSFTMKALPVYQVDFPPPVAAAGGDFGDSGFEVNPDNDMFDNMYCTVEDKITDAERLQDACNGNVLDITFPYLYPHVDAASPASPRGAFDKVTKQCHSVASNLWGYFKSYHNAPYKNMTFICGPPEHQGQVPFLGQTVQTDHGERTINNISFSYSDQSSFSMTVEVGPISLSLASAGTITRKKSKTESVRGRIVSHEYGALYKVNVPGVGTIKAWNTDHWPWNGGDRVEIQLYNQPQEV